MQSIPEKIEQPEKKLTYEDRHLKFDHHLYRRWQRRCIRWISWTKVKCEGLEKINRKGPVLITPNHDNWKDILFIGGMIRRTVHFAATYRLFDFHDCHNMLDEDRIIGKLAHFPLIREPMYIINYFLSKFLVTRVKGSGAIPAKLRTGDYSFFKAVKDAFDQNKLVCIFPEGRTSKEMRRFKLGISKILYDYYLETRVSVPVYPVGITGTYRCFHPGMRLGFFVGSPIYIENFIESSVLQTHVSFTNTLRENVIRLINQN